MTLPQPFQFRNMTTPSPHRTHGHLLHPWELATYLNQVQTSLRRAAPLMAGRLNRVGPNIPNYEYLDEPRQLLAHMQQQITDQERVIADAFLPLPTPFIPNDDYGFLRRPEPHVPAPMLIDAVYILVAAVHQQESN